MKLLVKDVRNDIAKELACDPQDPRVINYINKAVELMTLVNDWANMQQIMSFVAYNGYLSLPPNVAVPLKFNVGGRTGQPYGRHYQFTYSGPGLNENWKYNGNALIDLGEFPTTYDVDPDNPQRLALWSDASENIPFSVTIRGFDENGMEVREANGSVGETITWSGNDDSTCTIEKDIKLTTHKFSQITQVSKNVSKGYTTICTINDSEVLDRVISCIHPYETCPSYRRFQIYGNPGSNSDGYTIIRGLFRMTYAPVYLDDDPLIITLKNALILGVKAIRLYEADEYQKAAALEGVIERMLEKQASQYFIQDNIIDTDEGYGFSDVENV